MNNRIDDSAPKRSRPTLRLSTAPLVMHESTCKHSANKRGRHSDSEDDSAQRVSLGRQSPRDRYDRNGFGTFHPKDITPQGHFTPILSQLNYGEIILKVG